MPLKNEGPAGRGAAGWGCGLEAAEGEGDLLRKGRGRVPGKHLNRTGDYRVGGFRIGDAHAVAGLNHPELDSLPVEDYLAGGGHIDCHEDALDERGQLPVDGINPVNDRLGLQG
jgi:hypothetical protein